MCATAWSGWRHPKLEETGTLVLNLSNQRRSQPLQRSQVPAGRRQEKSDERHLVVRGRERQRHAGDARAEAEAVGPRDQTALLRSAEQTVAEDCHSAMRTPGIV